MGVDGKIGDGPFVKVFLLAPFHALGDGVLMAAAERCEHQRSGVGGALIYMHARDLFVFGNNGGHVGKIQPGVHAVAVHIHGDGNDVHVARALAVAEQRALHAVRAGQQAQLGVGHAAAPVVVRVQAKDDVLTILQVVAHVFDLVGIHMAHAHGHGDGQVDDNGLFRRGLQNVQHRVADLQRVFRFGAREAFGAVFKAEIALVLGRELLDERRAVRGDLLDLLLRFFKHLLALRHAGGIVEMHHRAGRALEGVEGSADDMVAALGEHLHRHVVRDEVLFDERAQKFVLRFAGGGEPDLDLLEAQLDEKTEKIQLFLQAHGYDKALVAVAQIYAAPDGRFFNVVFFCPAHFAPGGGKISGFVLVCMHHGSILLFLFGFGGWPWERKKLRLMAVWAKRRSFKNQLRGTTLVAGKHPAASCHQPAKQANSLT